MPTELPQENSEMAVVVTDSDSRVLYCNHVQAAKTGFAVNEIIGKKPGELWGGHMDRAFYETLWRTIKTDQRPFFGQANNQSRRDMAWTEQLSIAPALNKRGDSQFFIQMSAQTDNPRVRTAFEHEFLQTCEQQVQTPDRVISRFASWLSIAYEYTGQSLADFIHTHLIAPTAVRYQARTDDAELVARAQNDPNAFALLYKKYYAEIRHYFSLHLNTNHANADDFTQETFLSAYKTLKTYRQSNASYRTFLLRIAHNTLVDHYRKRQDILVDDWTVMERNGLDSCTHIIPSDQSGILTALKHLPAHEQRALRLKYERDFSTRQIASDMNKSENAVKLLISRGRKRLRDTFLP